MKEVTRCLSSLMGLTFFDYYYLSSFLSHRAAAAT